MSLSVSLTYSHAPIMGYGFDNYWLWRYVLIQPSRKVHAKIIHALLFQQEKISVNFWKDFLKCQVSSLERNFSGLGRQKMIFPTHKQLAERHCLVIWPAKWILLSSVKRQSVPKTDKLNNILKYKISNNQIQGGQN